MLTQREKEKVITKHKIHKSDTGSSEVQIALLSEKVENSSRPFSTECQESKSPEAISSGLVLDSDFCGTLKNDRMY